MQLPVLIEPLSNDSFRATSGEPVPVVVEAPTPDEAMQKVQQAIRTKLESGARLASIVLTTGEHTWLPFAGMLSSDDPLVQEWIEVMKESRAAPEPTS
jgi:hypothetical protein